MSHNEIDNDIEIVFAKPSAGEYLDVVVGKHRSQGHAGRYQYTRGQTPALIPMDGTPFVEHSHPEPVKAESPSVNWSDLD